MRNILVILFIVLAGCGEKPQVRQYTEIMMDAPQTMTGPVESDPHAGLDMAAASAMAAAHNAGAAKIVWDVPAGWAQEPGGNMRLATFRLAADPQAFDCSIVSLPGGAGGLEANLKRWMGQIHLDVSDEQLAQFMAASKDNVFDFTQMQKGRDHLTDSMIAAMIEVDTDTIFVKMKGTIAAVSKNKDSFLVLVKSVRSQ